MKDKIFMTFLCVAVFGVTNAMGEVGDGVGTCVVQAEVRPGDVERYGEGDDTSVWLKDDLLFISDNEALRCGGDFCGEGVEIENFYNVFRCTVAGGTGKWQKVELGVDIPFCDDSEINVLDVNNADYSTSPIGEGDENFFVGRNFIDTKGFCVDAKCLLDHRYIDGKCVHTECIHLIDSGKATGWDDENNACLCNDTANAEWRDYNCVCKDTVHANMGNDGMCVCADGMEFDEDGKCVNKVAEPNAGAGGAGNQNEGNPEKTACQSLVSSGKATEWDDTANTCSCKDTTNAEWKNNDCVCKDTKAKMDSNGKCVCADGMGFDKDGKCVQKSNKIDELGSWLDAETEKFERSKWRDAEGKFNTARLASDSIAGVVLGTAGGLISSKVIKKKQVENGFEDIKCTIGSQEVADWGDEFQVGIQ